MFTYIQQSGAMLLDNGVQLGFGYAGHGLGMNNPSMQSVTGTGPLPVGMYTILPPHYPIDHLGPLALPLVPDKHNEMFGRSGFFIHGDNKLMNHTASNGCIILARELRDRINKSGDKRLRVIAKNMPKDG